MRADLTIHDDAVRRALREVAKGAQREAADIVVSAAKRTILPVAHTMAPSIVAHTIVIKRGPKIGDATLTTEARGKLRAIFVLLDQGGQTRKWIRPNPPHKALKINGRYVSRVTGVRTYKGSHFLARAAKAAEPAWHREVERQLVAWVKKKMS